MGVGADKGKPAIGRRAGSRSSRHERKRLREPVFLFLRDNWTSPRMSVLQLYRFDIKINIDPRIIRPDIADLSGSRLRAGGRNSRASERAPQGTACISPRGGRGSQVHRGGEALKMGHRGQHARISTRAETKKTFGTEWHHG